MIFGLLGILFVALKLCGVIAWSWWLVTLPFTAWIILFFAAIAFVFLVAIFGENSRY